MPKKNIAKGKTDLRVEFCLPNYIYLDQISSSESRPSINFKISTKHQPHHKTCTEYTFILEKIHKVLPKALRGNSCTCVTIKHKLQNLDQT